jgi:MFS family permease
MWGKMFKFFPLKVTHLVTLFIFELGSLVCAITPTNKGLIAGRAIAGIGAAGLCTGTFTIIGYTVEPALQATSWVSWVPPMLRLASLGPSSAVP